MKYYNKTVKPWMEKNVKPAIHKRLDPIWNHPVTQAVINNGYSIYNGIKKWAFG
ncbi:MAG: hypothetical protein HZC47_05895 [Methanobacterium sp.]|uniref:hypothetical protein n=1 Tax=Methanobacterium sp. TaxID=2164 RepID=UPI003D646B31|nr:hypothetical protein [Methanobacterium sp.]